MTRIGREGFHVAPLALGVERVKGQAGFPRATHTGDNRELPEGDIEIDVAQVVLADSAQPDGVPAVSRVARTHGSDLPDPEKNASPQADPGNRICC